MRRNTYFLGWVTKVLESTSFSPTGGCQGALMTSATVINDVPPTASKQATMSRSCQLFHTIGRLRVCRWSTQKRGLLFFFRNGITRRTPCTRMFLDTFRLDHLLYALIGNEISMGVSLVGGKGKMASATLHLTNSFADNQKTGHYPAHRPRTGACC